MIFGFLLTFIPGQNLAFFDSTSQIINIAGGLLVTLRFRESWYVWLANNIIDLSIWIINVVRNTQNSQMMLVVSVMYFVMNVYGLVEWVLIEKRQKAKSTTGIKVQNGEEKTADEITENNKG